MVELQEIYITPEGENLKIKFSTNETVEEVYLHPYSTYPNTDIAYDISEFFESGTEALINCNVVGLLIYEDSYILEIITKDNGREYSTKHFFGNFTKIYSCIVDSTKDLKLKNCELVDSETTSVDVATKNFIDLELIKILVEQEDYELASRVLCQLQDRCNCSNCESIYALVPILGYNFITE